MKPGVRATTYLALGMSQAQNMILTYLNRLDPETRVEMAGHMRSLVQHPGWNVLNTLLADRITTAREVVESGLHEHVEYASQHGNIRGLKFAQEIPDAVIEAGSRADTQLRQMAAQEAA